MQKFRIPLRGGVQNVFFIDYYFNLLLVNTSVF